LRFVVKPVRAVLVVWKGKPLRIKSRAEEKSKILNNECPTLNDEVGRGEEPTPPLRAPLQWRGSGEGLTG